MNIAKKCKKKRKAQALAPFFEFCKKNLSNKNYYGTLTILHFCFFFRIFPLGNN